MGGRYRFRRRAPGGPPRLLAAVAAVLLVGGQTGCDADEGRREPPAPAPVAETPVGDAEPPDPATPPDAVPAELQGTWSLGVYCAAVGGSREEPAFGRIAERPARSEAHRAEPTTMTLTLYPEYFEMSWQRPDGTWQVGWSGLATLRRDSLYLDYRYPDGFRDAFSWSAHGRRLALRYPASDGDRASGLPGEASSVTHFSLPWTAVDCPPEHPSAAR